MFFVSYSSMDWETAEAVCAALEVKGLQCWMAPRDITPGDDWGSALFAGIQRADALVLVFSAHANQSSQVKREVSHAIRRGMSVLPFRLDDTAPGAAFALLHAEFAAAGDASDRFETRVATLAAAATRHGPDSGPGLPGDERAAAALRSAPLLRVAVRLAIVVAWVRLAIGVVVNCIYWFDKLSIDDVREYLIFALPYHAASVALLLAAIGMWLSDAVDTAGPLTNEDARQALVRERRNLFAPDRLMRALSRSAPSARHAWMARAWWPTGAAALLLTIALTIAGGTESATPLLLLSMDLAATIVWLCMVLLTRAMTRSVAGVASTQPPPAPAASNV